MKSVRTLLHQIVDYAGLFPPASLAMAPAVQNYAAYQAGVEAWMLGRFIVPAARLDEFTEAAQPLLPRDTHAAPWRLSVLGGTDPHADMARIHAFNQRHAKGAHGGAVVDAIELKIGQLESIDKALGGLSGALQRYVEIPIAEDPRDLIGALASAGAAAKVRTGGVSQDMFPTTTQLLGFLQACVAAGVPFKATAGLHHPIRSVQRLTYEPDSPSGTMHGFLNVFLAAAFLHAGLPARVAAEVLEEQSPAAFRFDDGGVAWGGRRLDNRMLADTRQRLAHSFGSCSFEEPIADLKALNLL